VKEINFELGWYTKEERRVVDRRRRGNVRGGETRALIEDIRSHDPKA
jgi:hypothetical protein